MGNRIGSIIHKAVIVALILLSACAQNAPVVPSSPGTSDALRTVSKSPQDLLLINSIFIAPPIPGKQAEVLSKDTEKRFYDTLRLAASNELSLETKFLDDKSNSSGSSPLALARAHGADSALITTVHRFKEREGNSLGITQAAEVSFNMTIVRLSDNKIIWESSYSFVDTALSEDIISYSKKLQAKGGTGGWTTAAKLIERGAKEGFRDFTQKRNSQFMSPPLKR